MHTTVVATLVAIEFRTAGFPSNLMRSVGKRLWPRPAPALLVRGGALVRAEAVWELGVYGVFLADAAAPPLAPPLLNEAAGTLLRTKAAESDEGGVAAGFAVLDSPWPV